MNSAMLFRAAKLVALFVVACLAMRMLLTRNWRTEVLQNRIGAPPRLVWASLTEIFVYLVGAIALAILNETRRFPLEHPTFVIAHFVFVTIGLLIHKGQWPHLPVQEQERNRA